MHSRNGDSRPVYLLTPRSEVVRYELDGSELHLANLRTRQQVSREGERTALVD
jgi:hypothetical protein